jgi:hypothetical protein
LSAEVTHINSRGLWLLVDDQEHFLAFRLFPWFRAAPIGAVMKVTRPSRARLRWPDLDVDLALDSIAHPAKYPLVSSHGQSLAKDAPRKRVRPR